MKILGFLVIAAIFGACVKAVGRVFLTVCEFAFAQLHLAQLHLVHFHHVN